MYKKIALISLLVGALLINSTYAMTHILTKQSFETTASFLPDPASTDILVNQEDPIFAMVDEMPQFPGGESKLIEFINKNVKYPVEAQTQKISGRSIVAFVVEKDGSISNPEVKRPSSPSLDKEALRVVSTMPKWTPGKQKGKPVRTRYTLPVVFRLQ